MVLFYEQEEVKKMYRKVVTILIVSRALFFKYHKKRNYFIISKIKLLNKGLLLLG
jgi:hypothetical protein